MEHKILDRSQQDPANCWALEDLYATPADWERDLAELKDLTGKLAGFSGVFTTSADQLLALLQLDDSLSVLLDKLANYAQRRSDEDTRIGANQELVSRITAAWVDLSAAAAFLTPELLELPDETLEDYYRQCPALEVYRWHIYNIRRQKAHTLSKAEERLLAAAGEMANAPDTIYSMLADADLTFPDVQDAAGAAHPLTQGTYVSYLESTDRTLRKNAFTAMYQVYGGVQNTCAAVLAAQVKQLQFFAASRRYASPLEAALDGTHVPVSVYDNLIKTVHENLDKLHRYVRLRKEKLGVDELHMYDLYAPLAQAPGAAHSTLTRRSRPSPRPWPRWARPTAQFCRRASGNRWIDVYENPGKRSGAYSAGARVHPYVLLNYTGTLDSQFTLAHEMGHAIHSYLSNQTQPVVYADYVIFVAEVASTCNEALLMEHLLSTHDVISSSGRISSTTSSSSSRGRCTVRRCLPSLSCCMAEAEPGRARR